MSESTDPKRPEDEQQQLLADVGLSPGNWHALLIVPFYEVELLKQKEMHSRAINREPEQNWTRGTLLVNQRVMERVKDNLHRDFAHLMKPTPGVQQGIDSFVETLLAIDATETEEQHLLKRAIILLAWHMAEKMEEGDRDSYYRRWEEILKNNYRHQSPETFHLALRTISDLIEKHSSGVGIQAIEELAPLPEMLTPEERLVNYWRTVAHRLGELPRFEREQALKELRVRLCEVDSRPLPFEVELALNEISYLARQLTNLAMAEDAEKSDEQEQSEEAVTDIQPPAPVTELEAPITDVPASSLEQEIELEPITEPMPKTEPIVPGTLPMASPPSVEVIQSSPLTHTSWEDLLSRINNTPMAGMERILDSTMLFDDCRSECQEVALVRDALKMPPELWFVGDIHADPIALHYAWLYIRDQAQSRGQKPSVVFLGDLIDRGGHSHETLMYLFNLIQLQPEHICVLAGNHDIGFAWDEESGRFGIRVAPAEYAAHLNAMLDQGVGPEDPRIGVARLAGIFFRNRPRALALPDGLFVSHAGIPHTDLQDGLSMPADLCKEECLHDYLWLHVNEGRPSVPPERDVSGGEFGYEDFNSFCDLMTNRLGIPVNRMIRGHDHLQERYSVPAAFVSNPVLTINSMSRRLSDETGRQFPLACVARYVPGKIPEVHQLTISEEVIREAFYSGPST